MYASLEDLYEITFCIKYFLKFNIEEIDSLTTHEVTRYLSLYKENKAKEADIVRNIKVKRDTRNKVERR